ncbi:DUF3899 domain-containing protein [Sporosarcina sp. G11-34]|uniref:DUF3899 domain-containing protein n=1 Tax=Sporosarcina sp. G11-34 TaxID=2849605 RepID=UPI0022A9C4E0|nr:DUF3899 domain-containing protein [Sporosarcina sp. G11-34]MCZ2257354.1 DUF3899 domain-containing protein [Sporosarcina sp. G11-34]
MKLNISIASVTLIIWLLLINMKKLLLLEIIDVTFLVGMITLVIFAIIVIIESKFLNLFTNGFKKINYLLFPQSRASKRAEELADNDQKLIEWKSSVKGIAKRVTAIITITTMGTSLVCLALYYLV